MKEPSAITLSNDGTNKVAANLLRMGGKKLLRSARAITVGPGLRNTKVGSQCSLSPDTKSHCENIFSSKVGTFSENGDMMNQIEFNKAASQSILNTELREKVASAMLQLNKQNEEHEKRAKATRILFRQAELGLAAVPNTYDEYEQKIASIVNQGNLGVLEMAMEFSSGNARFGELSATEKTASNPASAFEAEVIGW